MKKIINVLIFLFIVGIICWLQWYDIYTIDDVVQPFFNGESLKNIIMTADHGRYISWITMKIIVDGVSQLFHIHYLDNYFAILIRGVIFASSLYLIAKTSGLHTKSINPLVFLFVFILAAICFSGKGIQHYNQNFAYLMNFCFFIPPFIILANYFINNQLPVTKRKLFINCAWCFIIGISAHFNFITMTGIVIFLYTYLFLKSRNKKSFFLKSFNINIILPFLFFVIGCLCAIFSQSFQLLASTDRHPRISRFDFIMHNIGDYCSELIRHLVHTHQMELTIILSLSILYLILQKRILRDFILAYSVIFGILIFNLSLIACGKTYGYGKPMALRQYWFYHHDLTYMTTLFLMISIAVLLGNILSNVRHYQKVKILFLSVIIMLPFMNYQKLNHTYKSNYATKKQKMYTYQMDKAIIFYKLRGSDKVYFPQNKTLPRRNNKLKHWYFIPFQRRIYENYAIDLKRPLVSLSYKAFMRQAKKDGLIFTQQELDELNFTKLKKYNVDFGDTRCYPVK